MKKSYLIILTLILIGILSTLYFKPFSSAEIIVLDHMTEYNNGIINQICLVNNPPSNSKKLHSMIIKFNEQYSNDYALFQRLFIKKHDYELPIFPFTHNINYRSETTSRDDLDNIDFLGDSYVLVELNGDTVQRTKMYVGEIYYYKR